MKILACTAALLFAIGSPHAADLDALKAQVTAAERAFAKSMVDRDIARLHECLVEAARSPGMVAIDVLAQYHGMHDRKNSGAAKVIGLDCTRIGEQPPHLRRAFDERRRNLGR